MNRVALIIRHQTVAGRRDDARRAWETYMLPAIAPNPGHLAYVYCIDDADPDVICAFQMYADEDEATKFLQHPSYSEYLRAAGPFLSGPPQVTKLRPVWAKGD